MKILMNFAFKFLYQYLLNSFNNLYEDIGLMYWATEQHSWNAVSLSSLVPRAENTI